MTFTPIGPRDAKPHRRPNGQKIYTALQGLRGGIYDVYAYRRDTEIEEAQQGEPDDTTSENAHNAKQCIWNDLFTEGE